MTGDVFTVARASGPCQGAFEGTSGGSSLKNHCAMGGLLFPLATWFFKFLIPTVRSTPFDTGETPVLQEEGEITA